MGRIVVSASARDRIRPARGGDEKTTNMYEHFYNLRERPFALSPDPEYLYLSRVHREALDAIRRGIESWAGFIVVTGEIGAGKTTLLLTLLRRLDERTAVARLVNTTLEPRELLEAILLDFGLPVTGKSKPGLLGDLVEFLVEQRVQGRRALLVIDEAQNLSPTALEEVRLLSNLETEKSKLLQILFVGQPNLRETIGSPGLEQFRQRVAVSYHLTALDAPETAAYINYRLQRAAIGAPLRFPAAAAQLVHSRSRGVPRIINVICDAALIFGYAEGRRTIDRALLEEVIAELEVTGVLLPAASKKTRAPARVSDRAAAVLAEPRPAAPPVEPGQEEQILAASEPVMPTREEAAASETVLVREREVVRRRLAAVAAREQALARRERQLAQQQHIMSEEYRLLRQHRAEGPAAPARRQTVASEAYRAHSRGQAWTPFWQRIVKLLGREAALRP
jgi:putative secretion ATPase (PEP-CTERM system associated)